MLRNLVARTVWASKCHAQAFSGREIGPNITSGYIASKIGVAEDVGYQNRPFHTTLTKYKTEDRKMMAASMPKLNEGTEGEVQVQVDANLRKFGVVFPDENTPDQLFDGVRFDDLPILHIKVSKNNTIMALTDSEGKIYMKRSCGIEGFKNARKGTTVAAQATGISLATRAVQKGFKNVRVQVKGLGPGRISAVKGATMGGLNVVCISDVTFINWFNNPRPPAARSL